MKPYQVLLHAVDRVRISCICLNPTIEDVDDEIIKKVALELSNNAIQLLEELKTICKEYNERELKTEETWEKAVDTVKRDLSQSFRYLADVDGKPIDDMVKAEKEKFVTRIIETMSEDEEIDNKVIV